jgi:cell division septal protein FtsQ
MADPRLRQIDLFENVPDPTVKSAPAPRRKRVEPDAVPTQGSNAVRRTTRDTGEAASSTPSRGFRLRYLLLVLIAGSGITVWSWYSSRMTDINRVQVSQNYFTDESAIIAQAAIASGTPADSLNYVAIIRQVERLPYVREAELVPIPPSTILIRVVERRPIGLIKQGNLVRYVDRDGVVLPVVDGKAIEVPLLYGLSLPVGRDTLTSPAFRAMGQFLEMLDRNDMAKITISDVAWEPGTGIVAATGDYSTRLIFGTEDYEAKLRAWQAFYSQVVPKAGLQPFTRIDFRYRGQIVTEKRPS